MTIPEGVDPYSPYIPEGMPELKVGMRVHVKVSGECSLECTACDSKSNHYGEMGEGTVRGNVWDRPPFSITCGGCGSERDSREFGQSTGHIYGVRLDKTGDISSFTASELIPLEPSTNLQKE